MNTPKARIVINTLTDTGGGFEVGNSLIAYPNPVAMAFSLGVAGLSYTARGVGEAKHLGVAVPTFLEKIPRNLGTSLMISGVGLASASVAKTMSDGWSLDLAASVAEPVKASSSAILLAFGVANGTRGIARGLVQGGIRQKTLDTTAAICAAGGTMALVPDAHIAVKGLLFGAVMAEVATSFGVKKIPVGMTEFLLASVNILNASYSAGKGQLSLAIANTIFAVALVSLAALKRYGGVHQAIVKPMCR